METEKQKKVEIYSLYNLISEELNNPDKVEREYGFALTMNESILKPIIDAFNKERKPPSEGFKKYVEERNKLINTYSEPDEVINGQKFVKKNYGLFMNELTVLNAKEEYVSVIEENNRNEMEFNDFLNTDYNGEISYYKIPITEFPKMIEPKKVFLLKNIVKMNS